MHHIVSLREGVKSFPWCFIFVAHAAAAHLTVQKCHCDWLDSGRV